MGIFITRSATHLVHTLTWPLETDVGTEFETRAGRVVEMKTFGVAIVLLGLIAANSAFAQQLICAGAEGKYANSSLVYCSEIPSIRAGKIPSNCRSNQSQCLYPAWY